MTLEEIREAVAAGKTVHWANPGYRVVDGGRAGLLIRWEGYGSPNSIGLTHADGVTLNGKESEFFLGGGAS